MMLQLTRKGLVLHGRLDVLQDRFATVVVLETLLKHAKALPAENVRY